MPKYRSARPRCAISCTVSELPAARGVSYIGNTAALGAAPRARRCPSDTAGAVSFSSVTVQHYVCVRTYCDKRPPRGKLTRAQRAAKNFTQMESAQPQNRFLKTLKL